MSEMTIDEAIADCVRQVPECATRHTLSARLDKHCDCSDAPTMTLRGMDDAARALWFHAAWVWLCGTMSRIEIWPPAKHGDGNGMYLVRGGAADHRFGEDPRPRYYPTEYHALAAACKLAKGIKP